MVRYQTIQYRILIDSYISDIHVNKKLKIESRKWMLNKYYDDNFKVSCTLYIQTLLKNHNSKYDNDLTYEKIQLDTNKEIIKYEIIHYEHNKDELFNDNISNVSSTVSSRKILFTDDNNEIIEQEFHPIENEEFRENIIENFRPDEDLKVINDNNGVLTMELQENIYENEIQRVTWIGLNLTSLPNI